MPFTGADFNQALDIKTDQAYTGYYDLIKKNVIIAEALLKAVEIKVATNDRQQVQDDFFGINKSNQLFTPATNTVSLIPGGSGITDYHHIMGMRAKFIKLISGVTITALSNTNPIRMTTSRNVNLRSGSAIEIAGVATNTNANGTRYVKRMKNNLFELYSNEELTLPVSGNGIYSGSGGIISNIYYNTAFNYKSERKFSTVDVPTVIDPFYEVADTVLKIYPLTSSCSQISIDYISTPIIIDVTDGTTDLLQVYSKRILYFIMDNTARILGGDMFDAGLAMREEAEMIQQP